ncbi:hypothetical protein OAO01_05340 [Oligoflexia bacterium]|nr:hypothetical protein [Oligoflexia bacterium]
MFTVSNNSAATTQSDAVPSTAHSAAAVPPLNASDTIKKLVALIGRANKAKKTLPADAQWYINGVNAIEELVGTAQPIATNGTNEPTARSAKDRWHIGCGKAIEELAEIGRPKDIRAILPMLGHENAYIRNVAAQSLRSTLEAHPNERTTKKLLSILRGKNQLASVYAGHVLRGSTSKRAQTELPEALDSERPWVRDAAIEALSGAKAAPVLSQLLTRLTSKDSFKRTVATRAIFANADPRLVDGAIKLLRDRPWYVRKSAADAIYSLLDERTVPKILQQLETGSVFDRLIAVYALTGAMHESFNDIDPAKVIAAHDAQEGVKAVRMAIRFARNGTLHSEVIDKLALRVINEQKK